MFGFNGSLKVRFKVAEYVPWFHYRKGHDFRYAIATCCFDIAFGIICEGFLEYLVKILEFPTKVGKVLGLTDTSPPLITCNKY